MKDTFLILCSLAILLLAILGWGVPKLVEKTRKRNLELKALLPLAKYESLLIFTGFKRMMESNSPYALDKTSFSVDAKIERYGWKPWERRCAIFIYAWYRNPRHILELTEGLQTYLNHYFADHTGRKFTTHLAVRRAKKTKESKDGSEVESR